jgi:hypothetical protein
MRMWDRKFTVTGLGGRLAALNIASRQKESLKVLFIYANPDDPELSGHACFLYVSPSLKLT